jgi:hypothetical protein
MSESRLICHAETPCSAINDIKVEIEFDAEGNLYLRYRLSGDLTQIRIPGPQLPSEVDGLWEHTCFEAFMATEHEDRYHEFNFSPSGQYARYAFSGYRIPSEWSQTIAPQIVVTKTNDSCTLQAVIARADLPANRAGKPFRLGLSAVVELLDGSLSYWALHHPLEHPDFHHRDGLILALNRSECF